MRRSDSSWPPAASSSSATGSALRRTCSLRPTAPSLPFGRLGPDLRWTYAVGQNRGQRPPRFLVFPWARAPFFDPGGTSTPDHSACRCGLPRLSKRRLPRSETFEAQSRGPRPPCVRFTPPVTRRGATLGSGWWSALSRRDILPRGSTEDFGVYFTFLLSRLGLAHDRSSEPTARACAHWRSSPSRAGDGPAGLLRRRWGHRFGRRRRGQRAEQGRAPQSP
jgi:hypothetical protein